MDATWPSRPGRWRLVEMGLGMLFVLAGTVKLIGMPFMIQLFAVLGVGQWLRYVTAVCELGGGVMMLAGWMPGVAALGLAGIMIGATTASIIIFDRSPIPPAVTMLVLLAVAWRHRPSAVVGRGR